MQKEKTVYISFVRSNGNEQCNKKILTWNSVYQSAEYCMAMEASGFSVRKRTALGLPIFFYYTSGRYVAWETNLPATPYIGPDEIVYNFSDKHSLQPDSYFTIVINRNNLKYSKRLLRALRVFEKKASQYSYGFAAALDEQMFSLFEHRPFLYSDISFMDFRQMICRLYERKILKVSYLFDKKEQYYKGVIFMLVYDKTVNFRYYFCEKENNLGHFLHVYTIETLLKEPDIEQIDLSGYSLKKDKEWLGIDEFKSQFGGEVIQFERMESRGKANLCCDKSRLQRCFMGR